MQSGSCLYKSLFTYFHTICQRSLGPFYIGSYYIKNYYMSKKTLTNFRFVDLHRLPLSSNLLSSVLSVESEGLHTHLPAVGVPLGHHGPGTQAVPHSLVISEAQTETVNDVQNRLLIPRRMYPSASSPSRPCCWHEGTSWSSTG